jgi:hypothetical protein
MQHTALKQIKYNRGQVTDKLSERSDMGLQNACGVVYNDVYINRYGQLQKAPVIRFASEFESNGSRNVGTSQLFTLFDTGADKVIPVKITDDEVSIYKPLSKSNPILQTSFQTAEQTVTLSGIVIIGGGLPEKVYQFGANMVVFGKNTPPFLITISSTDRYEHYTLSANSSYFDGAFDNVFVRGINTATPAGFTVPTSGNYVVSDDAGITTKKIITIARHGAGGAFTQDLVGQVINCPQLSGAVQVREVVNGDTLKAYVLSPLITANDSSTQIDINWGSGQSEWLFGYEKAFSSANGWPDSVCYVNQRLIFGGNDKYGNLIAASRIGVISDFDPNDGTESDAFSASIAAPQYCRIVDFVQSNDELRIATTYGEYAVSLSALTPTGIIQSGFQLRSQVGVKEGTPICDCGGLTAYVSNDGSAIHCTQFNLMQNKYAPISLTSQTEGVIKGCVDMVYLKNRANDEGNCLVGVNSDGSMFVGSIDTNAGLNGFVRMGAFNLSGIFNSEQTTTRIIKVLSCGPALWGILGVYQYASPLLPPAISESFLVRFELNGGFNLPVGNGYLDPSGVKHNSPITMPAIIGSLAFTGSQFRALYYDNNEYKFITPTGYTTDELLRIVTFTFADDIDQSKIVSAGFIQQSDWRSVELSLGMTTRELNKKIVKLSSVVEPVSFHGEGQNINEIYKISQEDTYKFLNLVVGQETPKLTDEQIDNPVKTIFSEGEDMSWRRGFDNPSRELHYGITMLAPFLIKSTTAVLEYDEVQ